LGRIKENGKVLITSAELSKRGKPTFDGIAVRREWAAAHPQFMADFTKVLAQAYSEYRKNPAAWTPDSAQVKANVKLIGGEPKDIATAVRLLAFPTAEEQASNAWLGDRAARALKATAEFLKEQKKIDAIAPDYSKYVTAAYAHAAAK
jgi:taurine transport system substrate-binding protein